MHCILHENLFKNSHHHSQDCCGGCCPRCCLHCSWGSWMSREIELPTICKFSLCSKLQVELCPPYMFNSSLLDPMNAILFGNSLDYFEDIIKFRWGHTWLRGVSECSNSVLIRDGGKTQGWSKTMWRCRTHNQETPRTTDKLLKMRRGKEILLLKVFKKVLR